MVLKGTVSRNVTWHFSSTLRPRTSVSPDSELRSVHGFRGGKMEDLSLAAYLYLLLGAVKRRRILSQNWLPGKLSMAMKAKYPQRTEVGIFLRKGMAARQPPTISDCRRLLSRCSLTSTWSRSSMSLSTSKTGSKTGASMSPEVEAIWIVDCFSSFRP